MTQKPWNELQVGDVVIGRTDPLHPEDDVTFTGPMTVQSVTTVDGKTLRAMFGQGRCGLAHPTDRRIAHLA